MGVARLMVPPEYDWVSDPITSIFSVRSIPKYATAPVVPYFNVNAQLSKHAHLAPNMYERKRKE